MKQQERIFVFLGQDFVKSAETFILMLTALGVEQRVPVLALTQRGLSEGQTPPVIDFSTPASIDPSKIILGSRTGTITLKVSEDSEIKLVVLGTQVDLEAFDIDSQVEIEHVLPTVQETEVSVHHTEAHDSEDEPETAEEVSVRLVRPCPDVTVLRSDRVLLAAPSKSAVKPSGEVIIESGFFNKPGDFGWLSKSYLMDEVFKSFTDAVVGTKALRSDLFVYPEALEIIEFLAQRTDLKMSAAKLLDSFNKTVCDNLISQIAVNLEQYNGHVPVTIELQNEALRNAAMFVPLLCKDQLSVSDAEGRAVQFKAIFARPVPTVRELYKLVSRDQELRRSVTYFHEANREMLEQEIFRTPVDLPFYDADSCLEELAKLQNGSNVLQEHLERKERFYAGHQRRIFRSCLAQLTEKQSTVLNAVG